MKTNYERSLILVLVLLFVFANSILGSYAEINERIREEQLERENTLHTIWNQLDNIALDAKAVSIYDVTHDVKLYGRNDDLVLPLASLTKIVSVPLAIKETPDIINISNTSIKNPGDDKLVPGDNWRSVELAKFALLISSNDATLALEENAPNLISKMNERMKRFNIQKMHFINATGLDISDTQAGAYGTADGVNKLAVYALLSNPELWSVTTLPETQFVSLSGRIYEAKNTDILTDKIPNLLFSKTGYTALSGGNLVVIFENGQGYRIAVTVLGSTFDGRFSDMEKIVRVLYNMQYEL